MRFGIACILHEMIHYCDRVSSEYKQHAIKHAQDDNYVWDPHQDEIFIEKKKEAIENGINVVDKFEMGETYDNANLKARIVLQNVLEDDDSSDSGNAVVHMSDNIVTLKTKGSDKFALSTLTESKIDFAACSQAD